MRRSIICRCCEGMAELISIDRVDGIFWIPAFAGMTGIVRE